MRHFSKPAQLTAFVLWFLLSLMSTGESLTGVGQAALFSTQDSIAPTSPTRATLTFGSCLQQWSAQPVWQSVLSLSPAAFIFLGDNVYSDKGKYLQQKEPARIAQAYQDLAEHPDFAEFARRATAQSMAFYATWDDHDYGRNDGGGDYPYRLASKQSFLDFFQLSQTASGDAQTAGVYQSHYMMLGSLEIQLIMLDTRSFRSPLEKHEHIACNNTNIAPQEDPQATVLGEQQWQWLEEQLQQPAQLRVIASSIQVIPEQHCFEKWANFPHERAKLLRLLKSAKAAPIVILSGDRHIAEVSRLDGKGWSHPLYEITASGLNSAMGLKGRLFTEANSYRLGDRILQDNFGAIHLLEEAQSRSLLLNIYSDAGEVLFEHRVHVTPGD